MRKELTRVRGRLVADLCPGVGHPVLGPEDAVEGGSLGAVTFVDAAFAAVFGSRQSSDSLASSISIEPDRQNDDRDSRGGLGGLTRRSCFCYRYRNRKNRGYGLGGTAQVMRPPAKRVLLHPHTADSSWTSCIRLQPSASWPKPSCKAQPTSKSCKVPSSLYVCVVVDRGVMVSCFRIKE